MSKPKRILVVDDEELNRSLLQGLLASLGYTPESASDGFQALEKLNAGFDLVLMDVMMPGMDGIEVVRRIRENRELYDIPIIMVTVLYDRDTRLRAVQAGANDFIAKPIDILEVSVRIQSLLKMKEAQDEIKRHRAELEETVEKRTAALLESEKRFRTLVETARYGIFIKDNELRYTDVNTAMVRFLDIQLSDIIAKTDKDVFGNDIAVQTQNVEYRVLQGQIPAQIPCCSSS
jgi:CheY-like chemotaxis protein